MIAPVAVGQARFTLPGLAADARGVVSGRDMAARFATLDRVVWFLRLLSAAGDLDECWLGLRLMLVRSPLGLREMVLLMPVPSTEAADLVARAARTAGGQAATGAGRHFVEYRDSRASLGYDVGEVARGAGDFVFYTPDQVLACQVEGERSLVRLLLGLDLLRRPSGSRAAAGDDGACYVTARRGLGARLCEYLGRVGVQARAAVCESTAESAFGLRAGFWLFHIEDLPARLCGLMSETPGLALYRPVADGVAVAAGYCHPINLAACRVLFPHDRLLLLAPRPTGATLLDPAPVFADIADLLPLPAFSAGEQPVASARSAQAKRLDVPLRLAWAAEAPARAKAAYLPWSQVGWLRRLCQALPPTALRGHRVALLDDAVLVVAADELAALPLGKLLDQAAPGVLVPAGMRLMPAVDPEALAERLGTGESSLLVFPSPGEPPLRIPAAALQTLDRRILSELTVEARPLVARSHVVVEREETVEIETDPLGPFPLWGLKSKRM
jgi:hypothetical protein